MLIAILLFSPVLRAIGIISFTVYLIEEPIAYALQYLANRYRYDHGLRQSYAAILLGVLDATLSWHLLEKPILHLRWRQHNASSGKGFPRLSSPEHPSQNNPPGKPNSSQLASDIHRPIE